jgi:hypothetical protein
VSDLEHRRITARALRELVVDAPTTSVVVTDEQRAGLCGALRSGAGTDRIFVDAWAVEGSGRRPSPFRWRPLNARRVVGNAALRRQRLDPRSTITASVRAEVDELVVRCAAGYARPGSLAHWLGTQPTPVIELVLAEAVSWATVALEAIEPAGVEWIPVPTDAYYDVAGARTTLRGRRDGVVGDPAGRVLLRLRGGQPARTAGAGLRADLVVDALSDRLGRAASRIVGLWPEAGVALAVDGSSTDVRAGARDLVLAARVRRGEHLEQVA